MKNFVKLAQPLTSFLKRGSFIWNDQTFSSFPILKEALVLAPVLELPDFSLPFKVECEALGSGIGAVLMQGGHPILYFSKVLSHKTKVMSAYDRELLALVLVVTKWKHYLFGTTFEVHTNHESLKHLWEQSIITPQKQRWLIKLMAFNFTIVYKQGKYN